MNRASVLKACMVILGQGTVVGRRHPEHSGCQPARADSLLLGTTAVTWFWPGSKATFRDAGHALFARAGSAEARARPARTCAAFAAGELTFTRRNPAIGFSCSTLHATQPGRSSARFAAR